MNYIDSRISSLQSEIAGLEGQLKYLHERGPSQVNFNWVDDDDMAWAQNTQQKYNNDHVREIENLQNRINMYVQDLNKLIAEKQAQPKEIPREKTISPSSNNNSSQHSGGNKTKSLSKTHYNDDDTQIAADIRTLIQSSEANNPVISKTFISDELNPEKCHLDSPESLDSFRHLLNHVDGIVLK